MIFCNIIIKRLMPRHQFIGKQTEKTNNYFQTNVSFEELVNNPKMEQIRKPNYQGSLLDEKIDKMADEYLTNPLLLKFKNRIIIGCLKNNWYIIDGQHRIEMGKNLYKDHGINDSLVFCWYICDVEDMLKEIYRSVNMDSLKNQYYVDDNDILGMIKDEFTGKLKSYHNNHFAKTKTTNSGKKKTIEEFVIELNSMGYFKSFESSQEAYDNLKNENNEFFEINRYQVNIENNGSNFYKQEIELINEHIIFSLKGNNFIEWLGDKTIQPFHKTKVNKSNISNYKKNAVWKKEFGEATSGKCPVSFCNTILKRGRGIKNGFQCGHVISEYNGGLTEPGNMRPICSGCNQSMGKTNWYDWDITLKK
jgi:hypothetical protein